MHARSGSDVNLRLSSFMVDRDIVGCNWVTVAADKWKQRPWNSNGTQLAKATHCQLEIDLHFSGSVSSCAAALQLWSR